MAASAVLDPFICLLPECGWPVHGHQEGVAAAVRDDLPSEGGGGGGEEAAAARGLVVVVVRTVTVRAVGRRRDRGRRGVNLAGELGYHLTDAGPVGASRSLAGANLPLIKFNLIYRIILLYSRKMQEHRIKLFVQRILL